ncbi:hypothetical protein GQ43DRAFT_437506 [Delitschia confertaspora ATCC 74209]|uniref:Uncharacterized protein n=1 Tax=Delitschia confertaspora ATCC 74209 TaxID=1513339 RepID=A0A9P4JUZ8_9PLEO|nr:hypothetical protein GQ43DRAFT_437506 [Delitschia confertaspora ATCC 74209]
MDAILSIIRSATRLLNLLLPFTNRSTPLLQDIIHTIALCGALYFAPGITDRYHSRQHQTGDRELHNIDVDGDPPDIPHDVGIVEEPSDTEEAFEEEEAPPQAPTPPNLQDQPQPPQPAQNDEFDVPGPANLNAPRATPQNRQIGKKKAASLARRDQRRAYHEFLQNQREQRRLEEEAVAAEREAALSSEKARRKAIEQDIVERAREERERKKEAERKEAEEEGRRRDRVVDTVRKELKVKGVVDLGDLTWKELKDMAWIESLVRAAGLLNKKEGGDRYTMITGEGWLVKLDKEVTQEAYAQAVAFGERNNGEVALNQFAEILQKVVLQRAKG